MEPGWGSARGKAYSAQSCPLSNPAVSYFYDQTSYNGLSITNGIGRRTGMSDAAGAEAWTYNVRGWPLVDHRTTNSVTKDTSYTYNLDGSVATLTYPSGRTITYQLNSGGTCGSGTCTAGRLLSATDAANGINYATNASYAPQGGLAGFTNGSAIQGVLTYNSRLQPLQLFYTTGTVPPISQLQQTTCPTTVGTIMHRTYSFGAGTNDNGNVNSITNCRDTNRGQNFLYDGLNRIQQAYSTGPAWGETFTIDAWGNLTNRGPVAGKTNYESLNSSPATSQNRLPGFGYDAAGNLTSNGSATYTYDAENRLLTTAGVTYIYDGDGNRVKKSSGTIYWGKGAIAESDLTASTTSWKEYVFFNSKRLARRDASNSSVRYFFSDHLGSTSMVTNSTGNIFEEDIDYFPYGGVASGAASDHYMFTGKERDAESGLDNFGARYDASSLGRFMTPDPLLNSGRPWNPQTWNRYAYARNNPLAIVDPTGLYDFKNTCASNDKACNAAFAQTQTNVRKAYAATQAAYDKAVKNGDTKAAAALKRTLDGLGAEGQKNARGQTVNISADPTLLGPGQTSFANGSTSTINIVLNPTRSNGSDDAQAETAHEGVHAGEITPGKPTWSQANSLEHDAYETESYFSQSIGFSDTRGFGEGDDMSKNYTLWNPSWAAADIETRRSHGVDAAAKAGADQDCANGGCKK